MLRKESDEGVESISGTKTSDSAKLLSTFILAVVAMAVVMAIAVWAVRTGLDAVADAVTPDASRAYVSQAEVIGVEY